ARHYNLVLEIHQGELPVLESVPQVSQLYGIPKVEESPSPGHFLEEGEQIKFGDTELQVIFTPGHSPASISLWNKKEDYLIAGDVLFYGSIGRTDLPGGDMQTLLSSIREKLFPLGDSCVVYSGHGPKTSIGFEKGSNPFLN
ncbi:MAG: MBL fold metallo-hydrolase, partial [Saprospiraceae bacterium]|nr:MBL fold metallo-hydrolase [Saprospiraceae bacterium]